MSFGGRCSNPERSVLLNRRRKVLQMPPFTVRGRISQPLHNATNRLRFTAMIDGQRARRSRYCDQGDHKCRKFSRGRLLKRGNELTSIGCLAGKVATKGSVSKCSASRAAPSFGDAAPTHIDFRRSAPKFPHSANFIAFDTQLTSSPLFSRSPSRRKDPERPRRVTRRRGPKQATW